tara:strand:+ start:7072 stop:9318 length:2247 start_codon:yes stop_codon:yes gene_type:complete
MKNFGKFFLILFLPLFIGFLNVSHAEVVKKVEVNGNERISLETILIFGDIKLGDNYESQDIKSVIKKLYETNFFSNISVELNNNLLTINLVENPIINSIIFNGEQARKYKEALIELLTLREKTSFIVNYIKSDINKIKEFYRNLGYYFVKIEAEIEKLERNRVNIIYTFDKGQKAKIAKINFLGDKKVREKRLRDIITSQETKFWKFLSRSVYLNQARIELDKRLLKNYYRNRGYYEVDITSSNVEYAEGQGFVLTYSINAGKRYKFKKIYAQVSPELDQSAFMSLEDEFNKIIGDYYSVRKITRILEKIDRLSELKELQFINHNISEKLDDDGVEVKINIFEGKKFTIERIDIAGNSVTNDDVIRSEMIVDEGDPYSELLVNKSMNQLKGRGIFGKVDYQVLEGSTPDLKVLKISIEEKATGEILAGAGIGTEGTSFMMAVSENNWLGKGIKFTSALNISEAKISGRFSMNNPNYKYSGNSVFTSLDVSSLDMKETSGYESSRTGFSAGTSFEQYQDVFVSGSFDATYEDVEVNKSSSSAIKKMDGTFYNLDFGYGITWDRRNQVFQPTDGYMTKFTQKLPLIQDSSSILNGFDASAYHTFSEDLIGSFKFHSRAIHGVDGDVRLTKRLFIPSKKLRGFNTAKIGPKDKEDYIGGNYYYTVGFDAQLPNLLPEAYKTDFSLFLDAGNLWSVDYDSSLDDSNKLRSAVGVSANVFTTIGPMSFTLAHDLSKAVNDETQAFNFQLGTSF